MSLNISLVVIGKNDEKKLKSIYDRDRLIEEIKENCFELIYVDSGSEDNSVSYMKRRGFKIYQIDKDSYKCASAGRYIGTREASGDYILFLDSDMLINNLSSLSSEIKKARDENFVGVVGKVIDIYPTGTIRERIRKSKDSIAPSFGGFIVLEREALIKCGNWDPGIPANEELELHTRISQHSGKILLSEHIYVDHFTCVANPIMELMSLYLPLRKGRYGAFGYVLRAVFNSGSFLELYRLAPEVFYFIISAISFVIFIVFDQMALSVISIALYVFLVLNRRSYKYLVVPPGVFFSMFYGLYKYNNIKVGYEEK
ncbi:glycosyltransferase [Vibrio vulnificus]|nr:glycosyltransferase [Vibrio vulnificus]EIZ1460220.1 glycosyltransferase [Vibrio vulnificus]EJE8572235.1 glycosyltransferase [Vibrio vulnificus]EME0077324.1 glycosyltransferase [Vibrio vulnificus]HAS8119886.1 glycosyltransferase [Vibrio vulnificus]